MKHVLRKLWLCRKPAGPEEMLEAQVKPLRKELAHAGLNEDTLRKMEPDERVAVLERARLDPYDFIYLAC